MKFEINKSELAKALNVGGSLAGSGKTTIAILSTAKFDVTENSLKVTSSNIETEVASEVQVVSSDGAFSVSSLNRLQSCCRAYRTRQWKLSLWIALHLWCAISVARCRFPTRKPMSSLCRRRLMMRCKSSLTPILL